MSAEHTALEIAPRHIDLARRIASKIRARSFTARTAEDREQRRLEAYAIELCAGEAEKLLSTSDVDVTTADCYGHWDVGHIRKLCAYRDVLKERVRELEGVSDER